MEELKLLIAVTIEVSSESTARLPNKASAVTSSSLGKSSRSSMEGGEAGSCLRRERLQFIKKLSRMKSKKECPRICSEKTRQRVTYQKRKGCIKNKTKQLAMLCDVKACAVIFGPDGGVETWPEDPSRIKSVIGMLKDCSAKKGLGYKKAAITEVGKETGAAKTESSEKGFSDWEVSLIKNMVDAKLEAVTKRLELLQSAKLEKEREIAGFHDQEATQVMQEQPCYNFPQRIPQWQPFPQRQQLPACDPFENNDFGVVNHQIYQQVPPQDVGYASNVMPLARVSPLMPESGFGQVPIRTDYLRPEVGSSTGTGNGILELLQSGAIDMGNFFY
ncbi:hypothetical protein RJ639_005615 [Escallonia herrerae]|uniref:MADS-box domain-containing protein n=1 Tax=Escallonia herrerae TaxID=1293975 RepID=A0AA89AXJ7_9ASTE|nr:hypothetical protein RJ639_005615 [Escallonia herrerae]